MGGAERRLGTTPTPTASLPSSSSSATTTRSSEHANVLPGGSVIQHHSPCVQRSLGSYRPVRRAGRHDGGGIHRGAGAVVTTSLWVVPFDSAQESALAAARRLRVV